EGAAVTCARAARAARAACGAAGSRAAARTAAEHAIRGVDGGSRGPHDVVSRHDGRGTVAARGYRGGSGDFDIGEAEHGNAVSFASFDVAVKRRRPVVEGRRRTAGVNGDDTVVYNQVALRAGAPGRIVDIR